MQHHGVKNLMMVINVRFLPCRPLLERENDFCRCLSDMFPELKVRKCSIDLSVVKGRHTKKTPTCGGSAVGKG